MKSTTKRWLRWAAPLAASALTCLILVVPIEAQLPSPGNNAVYNPSGHVVLSPAFIDASAFFPPNPGNHAADVCDAIFQILSGNLNFLQHGYPSTGAVIDLRGVSGANLTCHGSPWTEGTTTVTAPSTILLPAGTIVIPGTWVLPNNTHLIGEGDALNPPPATPVASGTILQANFSSGDMIDLGGPAPLCLAGVCTSVSVEHLILDGQGHAINGIVNSNAQDGTYVDHVSLYGIRGTGLLVQTNATNSGPYSNITFDTGGYASTGSTVCAQILNVSGGTHGLRQLSCTSESNDALARVAHSFPVAA